MNLRTRYYSMIEGCESGGVTVGQIAVELNKQRG